LYVVIWCALMWLLVGLRGVPYIKQLSLAAAVMIMSSFGALLAAVAVALLLDRTGHAMSWFSSTYLLFGLYVAPACCAILSTCLMAKKFFYKVLLIYMYAYPLVAWESKSWCTCHPNAHSLACSWMLCTGWLSGCVEWYGHDWDGEEYVNCFDFAISGHLCSALNYPYVKPGYWLFDVTLSPEWSRNDMDSISLTLRQEKIKN